MFESDNLKVLFDPNFDLNFYLEIIDKSALNLATKYTAIFGMAKYFWWYS